MYCCTGINEAGKFAEEIEGTYADSKGREFVIERRGGKKYKHYCKPEDVNKKVSRAKLFSRWGGSAHSRFFQGVCTRHVSSLFDFALYKIRASRLSDIMIPSVHLFHTGIQTTNRVQNRGLPKSFSKRWSLL